MSTIFENARSITMLPVAATAIEQYAAVQVTSAGLVEPAAAASETVIGYALESSAATGPGADSAIPVAILDGAKIVGIAVDDQVNAGELLAVSATAGQLDTATAGQVVVGMALEDSAAAGDWIQIAAIRGTKLA